MPLLEVVNLHIKDKGGVYRRANLTHCSKVAIDLGRLATGK
jgi:hypothetical protein